MKNNLDPAANPAPRPSITFVAPDFTSDVALALELTDDESLGDTVNALVDAGLTESLRASVEPEPNDSPAFPMAQRILLALDIFEHRYAEAARRGHDLVTAGLGARVGFMRIALAHHYSQMPAEAYRILEESGRPMSDYQMACCAARMGKHSLAMEHLIKTTAASEPNRIRALLDEDFEPLWAHFAFGGATFHDCYILSSPPMARLFEPVPPYDPSWDYYDHFDLARLPKRLWPAVKPQVLLATYIARVPGDRGYDDELSTALFTFRVADGINRRGRATIAWKMAMTVFGALGAAEKAAAKGDMMHARRHLTGIIGTFPHAASDIDICCSDAKLRLLATEFKAVEAARPRFIAESTEAYEKRDAARLREILKSCPPSVLSLGVIQMFNGHLAGADGDKETAIQAYSAAAHCWPDDAAPFHNAAQALAQLGRWDEAAELIARAPGSFHEVELCRVLVNAVAKRSLTGQGTEPASGNHTSTNPVVLPDPAGTQGPARDAAARGGP
jgi:tetratricopeptide (TPR) repeat protein